MYREMHRHLRDCIASGSEVWKFSPGFRNLPGLGSFSTKDTLDLLSKLERIIRNKREQLRRDEAKGRLDDISTLKRPTTIDRAEREKEAEQESTLTSSLDLEKFKADLAAISEAAQEGRNEGEVTRADDYGEDENVVLGSVIQRKTVVDLEQIMAEEDALDLAIRQGSDEGAAQAVSQAGSTASAPPSTHAAFAATVSGSNLNPAPSAKTATDSSVDATSGNDVPAPGSQEFTKRDAFMLKVMFTEQ